MNYIFVIIVVILLFIVLYIRKMSIFTGSFEPEMWIQSPWYEEIVETKRKTIEGRVGKEDKFKHLVGKNLIIKNKDMSNIVKVTDLKHYDTLDEYVDKHS